MRTASLQFTIMTEEEARRYLARSSPTAENYGDRVAAQRRLLPVVEPWERRELQLWRAERGEPLLPEPEPKTPEPEDLDQWGW